ncbi:Nucleotidyltransferase [Phlegmacium glaucopus]|nr:Nucleotidyltransferase [Phlegmacium glaucopus]
MMSNYLGMTLKTNMMEGRPTRSKSGGDYPGMPIPPCGDYDIKKASKVPRPPWLPAIVEGKAMSLDEEIRIFMRYMEPTAQEVRMRKGLVRRFTKLIASFNINASVQPVGSYVTGLYLPTSDIDMVLTFQLGLASSLSYNYSSSSRLLVLLGKIRDSGFASKVVDVLNASVPLIRITDKITGIEIDLTAADTHAVRATEAVQKWLQHSSLVKPLLFVVKMFLSIRRCGTTYTGGINSYALFWMVVAWVKLEMPKQKRVASSANDLSSVTAAFGGLSMSKQNVATSSSSSEGEDLGELLIKFLKFYAEEFDCYTNAIRIEPTPAYHTKSYGYSRYPITQRYLLSIYDPADAFVDMGSKAYGITHIQASFKSAYQTLADVEAKRKSGKRVGEAGVLGMILGGDYTKPASEMKMLASDYWLP